MIEQLALIFLGCWAAFILLVAYCVGLDYHGIKASWDHWLPWRWPRLRRNKKRLSGQE